MVASTPPPEPPLVSETAQYGIGQGPSKVISVSMPEGTLNALRERVGKRGLSAAITAAMERQLRDEVFDAHIAEYVREHGDFTEQERSSAREIIADAIARDAQWRATQK